MRTLIVILALVSPALARAELRLALVRFDGNAAPAAHLDVPALSLDAGTVVRDEGGGDRWGRGHGRVEPVLALVLGIIPGFGIGHLVAGSPRFPLWLVVDVVIAVVWYWGVWGDAWLEPGFPRGLFGLLVILERIVEGLDAFHEAGGRLADTFEPPPDERLARTYAHPERSAGALAAVVRF